MATFVEQQRDRLAAHLRKHTTAEVRFDTTSRKLYSTDASIYQVEPMGVVLPRTPQDVVAVVQICAEAHVSITPRGGGTSLSGQATGRGIVVDCSKYLNRILDIDKVGLKARVQPGVVLDNFNRTLGDFDLQFGPDVSTSSRANLGGMIGNNSAGSRSIIYGKTIDNVRRLNVVLSDGSQAEFGPVDMVEWSQKFKLTNLEGAIYREVGRILAESREEIVRRFPRILRRVSGYNLDALAGTAVLVGPATSRRPGLHQLVVGSEGTLVLIAEAEVDVMPRPKVRGLLIPQFTTLAAAMDAVAACLELRPTAIELMDGMLLELALGNLSLRDSTKMLDPRSKAIFMVEFSSDDAGEVADNVARLQKRLEGVNGLITATPAIDPAIRDPLWNLRRASMPLLYGIPGDSKPVTFIEDCAVAPERLPEFVATFRDILAKYRTDGSFYGHASVGCLHIRPLLNLKKTEDVIRMRRITEEITDLVLAHGGSLSGEHGDGLSRSEWNEKMFGSTIYSAFVAVKQAFDPNNLLNPGKIVNGPPMTENLRYPPGYAPSQPPTVYDYSKQEGFLRSVEMCNGNGACRKSTGGTMCPSYRATLDEADNPRGRANALRHALNDPESSPTSAVPRGLRQRWVHEVFDLCLGCKACKSECPSNVDVAKLKSEFTQFYYTGRPRPLGHLFVAAIPWLARLASPAAPLVNWVQRRGAFRWLLEKSAGIDHRRSLPEYHFDNFRRWFRRHTVDSNAGSRGKVLLLADCFTSYNEPEVGRAAVRVLERAGYRVELASMFCCGRTWISKGFLRVARSWVESQVGALARRVADGTPILGLEPSCILTLADEWTELLPGAATRTVAAAAKMADSWLAEQVRAGRCQLPLSQAKDRYVLHGHCHQKTLLGVAASAPALRLVPEADVRVLDVGCCGMAGSFGFEREHYELSLKIANLGLVPSLAKEPEATVVAPGTSCRHQIHDTTGRRALHPLQVVEQRLQ